MEILIELWWLLLLLSYVIAAYGICGISIKRAKLLGTMDRGWLFLAAPLLFPIWLTIITVEAIGKRLK